jgi:hypothetical protein
MKGGFMAGNDEKKSPLGAAMGTAMEEIAKDMVAVELHLVYIYKKDMPFDGELKLSGQLGRKGQCYMMLEMAKLFIKDFDPAKQGQGNILIAKGFPGVPGGRG